MNFIKNLEWRHATKKFDSSKKVSSENLELIKKAIQLSPSSYGLQLYKVLIIESKALREKLKAASYGQSQITEASHLIVFCNYSVVTEKHIEEYFALKSQIEKVDILDYKGYSEFIKADINNKSQIEKDKWTSNQTYLALGNLLNACAELKIDACPMEGFDAKEYNKILNLDEQGLNSAVIATIGYRSANDSTRYAKKVRKSTESLFELRNL
ncbi:NAD(P)H-dependent oxidoreductase [Polaribacter reichenbachii]|uniref:NAD(P)H-dependent oxidoreductase n=1 Tax=Polaribacter reichenbachii TaxID=996801 RepID=A0A1B8U2E7_9FLAO|nr:NAD(P)H-dependent oxidoreductase [Polaribacter reichenbachii]APZ47370.1 NAD(P)H-dependent oxidoreductase [Polaribacter reichenbachii]AUC18011.1 NAD(P)H-dependent oxidoreductase [Polaribacter reichenbachii]OBY66057.1 NAD(P)H-dependent oxidoreductase [Polaribacter reichenbachii]